MIDPSETHLKNRGYPRAAIQRDNGRPDALRTKAAPMPLQDCFSAAVSCPSGVVHAMTGPPNRRITSSSRKLILSFIDDERLQLTDRCTQCPHTSDTFRPTKVS